MVDHATIDLIAGHATKTTVCIVIVVKECHRIITAIVVMIVFVVLHSPKTLDRIDQVECVRNDRVLVTVTVIATIEPISGGIVREREVAAAKDATMTMIISAAATIVVGTALHHATEAVASDRVRHQIDAVTMSEHLRRRRQQSIDQNRLLLAPLVMHIIPKW